MQHTGYVLILGLAATMATVCLGQDFSSPPASYGNGPGQGFPAALNQQPNFPPPGLYGNGPGFPVPLNQQPDFPPPGQYGSGPGPWSPIPPNVQSGLRGPTVEPGTWPQPAAVGPEQPPVTAGLGPGSQGKSSDTWLPDDMMGFGGMGGLAEWAPLAAA